jgi:hypothetical protein
MYEKIFEYIGDKFDQFVGEIIGTCLISSIGVQKNRPHARADVLVAGGLF